MTVPECVANPATLACLHCKGFKSTGICSHVVHANHLLRMHNLKAAVAAYGRGKPKNEGGYQNCVHPGLTREDNVSVGDDNYGLLAEEWWCFRTIAL